MHVNLIGGMVAGAGFLVVDNFHHIRDYFDITIPESEFNLSFRHAWGQYSIVLCMFEGSLQTAELGETYLEFGLIDVGDKQFTPQQLSTDFVEIGLPSTVACYLDKETHMHFPLIFDKVEDAYSHAELRAEFQSTMFKVMGLEGKVS